MTVQTAQAVMPFIDFRQLMDIHITTAMAGHELYVTELSSEKMWDTYLKAFPAGSNEIYRERTEHDCSCCRNFIRDMGNVVAIIDEQLVTIWDIPNLEYPYATVAAAMAKLVKARPVTSLFKHYQAKVGTFSNPEQMDDGHVQTWNHFYYELPDGLVLPKTFLPTRLGQLNSLKQVSARSLREIGLGACETVLELIEQDSLYRGTEHKAVLAQFLAAKRLYDPLSQKKKHLFEWSAPTVPIRNSVIGTLLVDLSNGVELDVAVKAFEVKVAPANYKRPTALVTKAMVKNAEDKLTALGLLDALPHRHAQVSDLTINALIWADRSVKKELSVFDAIPTSGDKPQKFSKVEEVPIDKFLADIVPHAATIEVMVENSHLRSLVSFLAPVHGDAKPMFKWGNNFCWTYNGNMTDSIKEKVKAAGGSVSGLMRTSLAWYNYDDLDIHVKPPTGSEIYYGNKDTSFGRLDVDMNAGGRDSRNAVENVTWGNKRNLVEGTYKVRVHQYHKRENEDVGFEVELEYDGTIHTFHYDKAVQGFVDVATFKFTYKDGIEFIKSLPTTAAPRQEWGVTTNQFTPVRMLLNSPNHWEEKDTGNRHLFFVLDGCKNPEPVRGFFNEYLDSRMTQHRKVLEILGSKMKAPYDDEQLSGLGFSSTQRNHLICRITGAFNRTVKVLF